VVLSNHSVYMVFLDPHQGIDVFAFFLPTSKSLCGAQAGINVKTYLHCIYCRVKTRIQGERCHTLRSRYACVWNMYMVANRILLCSLKHSLYFSSNGTLKSLNSVCILTKALMLCLYILLLISLCGALGWIRVRHTCIACAAKSNNRSKEKYVIHLDQDMHVCENVVVMITP